MKINASPYYFHKHTHRPPCCFFFSRKLGITEMSGFLFLEYAFIFKMYFHYGNVLSFSRCAFISPNGLSFFRSTSPLLKYFTLIVITAVTSTVTSVHTGVFCQLPFCWIYYCHSIKTTRKETGKTHLCAVVTSAVTTEVIFL